MMWSKRILWIVLCICNISIWSTVYGQQNGTKKVAVLKTVDKEGKISMELEVEIGLYLRDAVRNTSGYEAHSYLLSDQNFQRTGILSAALFKKIDESLNADYILVCEAKKVGDMGLNLDGKLFNAKAFLLECKTSVTTGLYEKEQVEDACQLLIEKLFNGLASTNHSSIPAGENTPVYGQEFTETAFGINMKFVYVEGGKFNMGFFSTNWMTDKPRDDEKPNRTVTLDSYYMGIFEVTQQQWQLVMGTSVYQQRDKVGDYGLFGVDSDRPMYYVSWEEAQAFCQKLSQQTGKRYCLPTEAQWEYAARGGKHHKNTKYSGSNHLYEVGWSSFATRGDNQFVGRKKPNALGIYDMSGNVSELCQDWYGAYRIEDTNNPTGPSSGSRRVARGGNTSDSDDHFPKVYSRDTCEPNYRGSRYGFRVVLLP